MRSVLGPGVTIAKGAVEDAILFHDVVVGPQASVKLAVIDSAVIIERRARIGTARGEVQQTVSDDMITLVGKGVTIAEELVIEADSRVHP